MEGRSLGERSSADEVAAACGLFTDHTFAVWKSDELQPVASAYSGLVAKEIRKIDGTICTSGLEELAPVCTVRPFVFRIPLTPRQAVCGS